MEPLLTAKGLAEKLGLAEQTIYNRNSNGGDLPPSIKIGRAPRFRQSEVDAWLDRLQANTAAVIEDPPPKQRRRGRPSKAEQVAARGQTVG